VCCPACHDRFAHDLRPAFPTSLALLSSDTASSKPYKYGCALTMSQNRTYGASFSSDASIPLLVLENSITPNPPFCPTRVWAPSAAASRSVNESIGRSSLRASQIVTMESPKQAIRCGSNGSVTIPCTFDATLVVDGTGLRRSNRRSQREDIPARRMCVDCGRKHTEETVSVGACCCRTRPSTRGPASARGICGCGRRVPGAGCICMWL
jgi:hypothetical protein